jgi:hypothetical protein
MFNLSISFLEMFDFRNGAFSDAFTAFISIGVSKVVSFGLAIFCA